MPSFSDLKVGDRVNRRMGHNGPVMPMEVTKTEGDLIECAAIENGKLVPFGWTFDRVTGAEVDDFLHWGPKYGKTGTHLELA